MKQRICHLDDISPDGVMAFDRDDVRYLIYREGQAVFACEATCPHMGGALDEGEIANGCVTCPLHGWRFDLKSGHCENVKGQQLRVHALEVDKESQIIWNIDSSE